MRRPRFLNYRTGWRPSLYWNIQRSLWAIQCIVVGYGRGHQRVSLASYCWRIAPWRCPWAGRNKRWNCWLGLCITGELSLGGWSQISCTCMPHVVLVEWRLWTFAVCRTWCDPWDQSCRRTSLYSGRKNSLAFWWEWWSPQKVSLYSCVGDFFWWILGPLGSFGLLPLFRRTVLPLLFQSSHWLKKGLSQPWTGV